MSEEPKPTPEYPCTECGGDALMGFTGWRNRDGEVTIKEDERLCNRCAKERMGIDPNPWKK